VGFLKFKSAGRSSLKYKLLIAFALMSVIPLLILAYFVSNYVFPNAEGGLLQSTAIVLLTILISWGGYTLAKNIVLPVINLALETKIIAEGQYDSKILFKREDELGDIASAVNAMTGKMRGYLGQLQEYSKETASLNVKIHRKVLTLTNLMRLGDLISSGMSFDDVADFATKGMAGELYGGYCAVFIRTKAGKYSLKSVSENAGRDSDVDSIGEVLSSTEKLFASNEYLLSDSRPTSDPWQKTLKEKLGRMNVILFPMKIKTTIVGVIVASNFGDEVEFNNDDVEVLRAFAKELVLAYQSSQISERVKSLEMVDGLTGLYTFSCLEGRLEDEINRAQYYQRPCSLILVNVDDFKKYAEKNGMSQGKELLKQVGALLGEIAPSVGKVGRNDHDEFGILLPETNKREALEIAESIRDKTEKLKTPGKGDKITVSVGVGENPIDGATGKDIIAKARQYVEKAKDAGKNKVVGE